MKAKLLGLGLAVWAVTWAGERAGLFAGSELAVYDRWVASRAREVPDRDPVVTLVRITEADIGRFSHPVQDGLLAQALERLVVVAPRAIGVDLYRDRAVGAGHEALAAVLAEDPRIILVEKLADASGPGVSAPAFARPSQVGFSDVALDDDGSVRRAFLFMWDEQGESHLSFALRLALRFLEPDGVVLGAAAEDADSLQLGPTVLSPFEPDDGGYVDADAGGYQLLLDFAAGDALFPSFTLGELLDGAVPRSALAGRVVVLGTAAPSVKDLLATPLGVGSVDPHMSGMALHAHAVDQLVRHGRGQTEPLQVLPGLAEVCLVGLWVFLGVLASTRIRSAVLVAAAAAALPVLLLAGAGVAYRAGWWVPVAPAAFAGLAATGLGVAASLAQERAEKRQLAQIFGRYVSPAVFERIWAQRDEFMDGGRPRPQRLTATVLMADLVGFSEAAGELEPAALMEWLDACMSALARVVEEHGGVVEDYAGDGMKANFGVPIARQNEADVTADAHAATRCALAMGEALEPLNRELARAGRPPGRLRVGVETGPVVVGSLGSSDHLKYTSVGDAVVTAARLESFDRGAFARDPEASRLRVLVGEGCAPRLREEFRTELLGQAVLKGKRQPTDVYRVYGVLESEAEGDAS